MITRENYESFFMDYLEGNLPEGMIDQFLDFLNQNLDLKEELHLFEEVRLLEEDIVFSEKKQLYKTMADGTRQFENKTIAFMENDLNLNERKAFELYIAAHPELQKECDLFSKTRLTPDLEIRFPAKRKLYHPTGTTVVLNWVTRAAAVIALIWGISSVIQNTETPVSSTEVQQVATADPKKPVPITNSAPKQKENQAASTPEIKQEKQPDSFGKAIINEETVVKEEVKLAQNQSTAERDTILLAAIAPKVALFETAIKPQLADIPRFNEPKVTVPDNVMTVDQFLASRAKKVGKESLFSAQRIARLGLNIASELSGKRIGYEEKNGKITSVDFESKLMAFSIPLEKK